MPELVEKTAKAGLSGLEWAGGLPGTVGGAIFGNAGCFGHEIREIVHSVNAVKISTYDLRLTTYDKEECEFSYRNSKFKREGGWIILSCVLQFQKGNADELQRQAQEKIDYRKNRHPLEYPNIGSIFKNIDESKKVKRITAQFPELEELVRTRWYGKIPTAVLIEKAGLAGRQIGGAQVSQKHANFIVNKDNAKAQDVISLVQEIKNRIKMLFDINLQEEVRYVGL
ncbi:MAG: UDP-N-acetylmuramate dehydrogenase [Candidatus Portnoybacteria bacterium]|nr:UDP-N-acetylmuramate dehydrogenase [Candidatus Portnoybacteria bacterium]